MMEYLTYDKLDTAIVPGGRQERVWGRTQLACSLLSLKDGGMTNEMKGCIKMSLKESRLLTLDLSLCNGDLL